MTLSSLSYLCRRLFAYAMIFSPLMPSFDLRHSLDAIFALITLITFSCFDYSFRHIHIFITHTGLTLPCQIIRLIDTCTASPFFLCHIASYSPHFAISLQADSHSHIDFIRF